MNRPAGDTGATTDSSPSLRAGSALDLDNLQYFLTKIGAPRSAQTLSKATQKRTRRLFHYTDLAGLHGIVGEDDLWLTNARFSNDDSEMAHGYALARTVVDEHLKAARPQDQNFFAELLRLLNPETPDDVYICCFCEKGDLLSQWRAYGANGTGVSLEFGTRPLSEITGIDMPPAIGLMSFWKVYYKEEEQRELLRDIIKVGKKMRRAVNPRDGVRLRARKTADAVKFFIPTFKNQDFYEEREWRLIFTPGARCEVLPKFRVSRQILVPYYSLRALLQKAGANALDKLPISRVLIGPSARGALNKESAKMLLATWKYKTAQVDVSTTPFRGA